MVSQLPKVKERWSCSRAQKKQREEAFAPKEANLAQRKGKAEDTEEVSFHVVSRAVFNEWLPKVKERWLHSRAQKKQLELEAEAEREEAERQERKEEGERRKARLRKEEAEEAEAERRKARLQKEEAERRKAQREEEAVEEVKRLGNITFTISSSSWTDVEHSQFEQGVIAYGWGKWAAMARANIVPTRNHGQLKSHAQYFRRCHPSDYQRLVGNLALG